MSLIKTDVIKVVGKTMARTGLKLRKYSPEIMLAGGVIAGTAAIITACAATKKVVEEKVIEQARLDLNDIQNGEVDVADIDDPKVKKKESFRVFIRLIFELTKRFGPSAGLFLLSIFLYLASFGVLKKRYVSTTLAYKALDEAFKDYRKRMKEAVGEEKELHFFNGTEESGERTIIDENGESRTEKDIVKVHEKKYSPYEFDFNAKTAPGNWEANTDYNLAFLRSIQNYANDLLHSRGHVFLNDVLDAIGIQRTREGAVVGWILGGDGDDYVDFGISGFYYDEMTDIQNGCFKNIHLNFNVDGVIWDKI